MQALAKQTKAIALTVDGTNYVLAAGTTDVNSTSVDISGFDGVTFYVLVGTIAASGSVTCKLQYSTDNSNWTDVTGGGSGTTADTDDNKTIILEVIDPAARYYRVVTTRGDGGNSTINGLMAVCWAAKKQDVTADTTNYSTTSVVAAAS